MSTQKLTDIYYSREYLEDIAEWNKFCDDFHDFLQILPEIEEWKVENNEQADSNLPMP